MAEQLFKTVLGFSTDLTDIIDGAGPPLGTSGATALAPVDSSYRDSSSGEIYQKLTSTSSATDWGRLARAAELSGGGGSSGSFSISLSAGGVCAVALSGSTFPVILDTGGTCSVATS